MDLPHHPSGPGTRTAAVHGKRNSYYIYPTDSWVITSCCRPKNFCFNWTLIRSAAKSSSENESLLPDVLSAATSHPNSWLAAQKRLNEVSFVLRLCDRMTVITRFHLYADFAWGRRSLLSSCMSCFHYAFLNTNFCNLEAKQLEKWGKKLVFFVIKTVFISDKQSNYNYIKLALRFSLGWGNMRLQPV